MKHAFIKRACAAIALIAPVAISSAAVVTIDQTIDLYTLNLGTGYLNTSFKNPVSLSVGDTLRLNYDFLGDQTLIMNKPLAIFGQVTANDVACTDFSSTGSMTFVGAHGPTRNVIGETEINGCATFGNMFIAKQFTTAAGTIEFGGLQFELTVNSYSAGVSRDYSGPWLLMFADSYAIGAQHEDPSNVPEPGSLALVALGLGAIAYRGRRKRAVPTR